MKKSMQGGVIGLKMKLKKNRKFIVLAFIFLILSLSMFLYYRLFIEVSYSSDYDTIGTILNIELKEDEYNKYKELKIKYTDSKKNEILDKHKVYEDSDEYKKLNMYNAKVGSKVKINTEEGFAEGFLGKRLLYSSVSSILIYSEQEIEDAKDVVKIKFKSDFKGCELTDLWYSEEITISSLNGLAKQYNTDEAIVLLSNFDVDSYGGDGSLNPNQTYTDWHWILVRNKEDNKWILKTWGY